MKKWRETTKTNEKSKEIKENQWKMKKTNRKLKKIKENHWTIRKIQEKHEKMKEINETWPKNDKVSWTRKNWKLLKTLGFYHLFCHFSVIFLSFSTIFDVVL